MTSNPVREHNLSIIAAHYGHEEGIGLQMLQEVAAKYILDLLPDQAIAELAQRHMSHERHQQREAERKHRGI